MPRRYPLPIGLNSRGFSLTEVLITIVVLSIGFLGLSAMTLSTIKSLTFSKELTTATMLSQDKLEEIKKTNCADVIAENYPEEGYNTIQNYPQFKRVVTIAPGNLANTKNVTVTTFWKDNQANRSHHVSIQTIINH